VLAGGADCERFLLGHCVSVGSNWYKSTVTVKGRTCLEDCHVGEKVPAASGLVFFVRGSEGELKQCGMSSAPQSGTAAPDVSDSERVRNIEEEEEEKKPEVMGECCGGLQNNGGQLEWWKCPHRGQASVPLDIVCYTAAGMCCMQAETRTRHGRGFQQGKAGQGRAGQDRHRKNEQ
jgi:hypothetical protein